MKITNQNGSKPPLYTLAWSDRLIHAYILA
jgi:hypothetical protein